MKADSRLTAIQEAIDLLDEERAILMSGKIDDLFAFSARKENLLENLKNSSQELTREELSQIEEKSKRNAGLYQYVVAAQKSVIDRLAEITKAQKTLGTYSVDGTFKDNVQAPGKLETRS